MAYGYQAKTGVRTARAKASAVNASYKDLGNVCRNVRGKASEDAIEFLELAAKKQKAIWYARHSTGKGHRRELGGKIGGFPVKSVKAVLEVLKSASANAIRLGLGETKVAHIVANKEATYPRMSPKGRRIRHDYELAFIEVVLEERQEKAGKKPAEKQVSEKKASGKNNEAKKGANKSAEAKAPLEVKPAGSKPPAQPQAAAVQKS